MSADSEAPPVVDPRVDARADDAERALLGAIGHHPDACTALLAQLAPDAFYNPHRERVWTVLRDLAEQRSPLSPGHVTAALAGRAWLNPATRAAVAEMASPTPVRHAAAHAALIADLAARRDLQRRITAMRQVAAEDHYEPSEQLARMREILAVDVAGESATRPQRWAALVDEFRREHDADHDGRRILTPWTSVDRLIGGLHGSRVYVIGGRPGQGKSTAALVIAMHAAQLGRETLIVSREMPSVDVTGRLLARGTGVDLRDLNARKLTTVDRQKIEAHVDELGDLPLTVDARPRGLASIKSLARAHHHRHGLGLLVVDYLQLVNTDTPSRTREQEVAQVSMQLKGLAMELDIPVVLPAQLNRGSLTRAEQKPTMADLRDSGQIEQDADVVILLHRPRDERGHPTGEILFIVDKNRHGPTAELSLEWAGAYGDIA